MNERPNQPENRLDSQCQIRLAAAEAQPFIDGVKHSFETIHHRPCIASCGAPFILAELKSRAALAAASPNGDVFRLEVTKYPAVSIMIYTQVDEPDIHIRARMFAPHDNIPEDPATGSANVALIGLLAKLRPEPNLSLSKTIAQGVENILRAVRDGNSVFRLAVILTMHETHFRSGLTNISQEISNHFVAGGGDADRVRSRCKTSKRITSG